MTIQVRLLDHSHDPIQSLYLAYRTCYSPLTPQQIADRVATDQISQEDMARFVEERLETGHGSPLEQVWFEFLIAGVSRSFSHQFVRHRTGISFEQQSQRYVTFKRGVFPYTIPETVDRAGARERVEQLFAEIGSVYQQLVDAGVPGEDARFVLPNATSTNFKVTVNFAELLHICDLRLCTRAQWEFRKVASMMRGEINRVFPRLGRYLQPKCGERRAGFCDESRGDWEGCVIGRKRPHKQQLFELWDSYRRGDLAPLVEDDFEVISNYGNSSQGSGNTASGALA
jgi:thymidylate synthase (FAD)